MKISTFATLTPAAVYDRKTDGFFGRVNVHVHGRLAYYRVVRICRLTKDDALIDANEAIKEAREIGQLMI